MPLPIAAAAISLAPSIFKGISGLFQRRKITNPTDPGYQMNNEVIDNARILGDQYNNYTLPGYSQTVGNIDNTYSGAFQAGVNGASSGGDVLDLATKLAFGKTRALGDLSMQVGQGRQAALINYLNAKSAAGQELVNKNAYDRQKYMQELQRNAALEQSSAQNTYGAIDDASTALSSLLIRQQYANGGANA